MLWIANRFWSFLLCYLCLLIAVYTVFPRGNCKKEVKRLYTAWTELCISCRGTCVIYFGTNMAKVLDLRWPSGNDCMGVDIKKSQGPFRLHSPWWWSPRASPKTPITFYQSARPCAPKDLSFSQRRCENLRSGIWFQFHCRGGRFFCVRKGVHMCISVNCEYRHPQTQLQFLLFIVFIVRSATCYMFRPLRVINSLYTNMQKHTYSYIYIYQRQISPITGLRCPEDSRKLTFPDYMTVAQDGGKVVSLTHRPLFTPRK